MARQSTERVNTPTVWVVSGTLPFPIDMLRYDAAHPYREEDANLIARTIRHDVEGRAVVYVSMRGIPTQGRWESFGWRIDGVYDRAYDEVRPV